jgi:hypothetical protein
MNRITKGLVGLALLVTLAGCSPKEAELAKEYKEDNTVSSGNILEKETTTNIVQISDIRDKVVACHYYSGLNGYQSYNMAHDYEFVVIKDPTGEKVLIYPYAMYVFRKPAKVTFRPLTEGKISSEDFCTLYVSSSSTAEPDLYSIKADGIITKDGIKYEE